MPSISTKQTTTSHTKPLNIKNTTSDDGNPCSGWEGNRNVTGLNRSMETQTASSDNQISNGNTVTLYKLNIRLVLLCFAKLHRYILVNHCYIPFSFIYILSAYYNAFYICMVFNVTFNNISVISWRLALLVEETGGNHRPVTGH